VPKIVSSILLYGFLTLVLVGIIVGSIYLYTDTNSKKQNFNTVVQSFNTKTKAQAEVDKLTLMKETYTAQAELNSIGVNAYTSVTEALSDIDTTGLKADLLRRKINTLLAEWHTTINSIKDSSVPNTILINQANSELVLMQTYIKELQITGDQSAIDAAQALIDTAQSELSDAESAAGVTDTGGGLTVTPITQDDIQHQQQVVNQLVPPQSPTDTGSTEGESYTPPPSSPVFDASGTPQLIEGANTY
jgi:cell division protein FtsL